MKCIGISTLIVAGLLTAAPIVNAQSGIQIGILNCTVVPGSRVNLLIRSTADVECVFSSGDAKEEYKGDTGIALGLDLSFKENEKLAFTVIAATSDIRPGSGALAGKYVGGQVSAAAGLGLGAQALFGGGAKNIGLQPLAIETSTGLGVSGGLSFLYIEPK